MEEEKKARLLNEEEEAADQSDNPTGKPNVTAKRQIKKNYSDILWVLLGAAIIVGFAVVYYYQAVADIGKKPEQENDSSLFTSKRKLQLSEIVSDIVAPPPTSEPAVQQDSAPPEIKTEPATPPPEPEPEKKPDLPLVQTEATQPVLIAQPVMTNQAPKEPELTLEDRQNMAPMMGESKNPGTQGKSSNSAQYEMEAAPLTKFDNLLRASQTPSATAEMMPDRNFLLAKGTYIDCILETKVDTTVPGMTACVIPRNVYSANGKVLLIEKGSRAVGEYKSAVENGLNRIFVLWTQIQTPKGVRVTLDSPTTDALGGAGMSGEVDFHWWKRFGNALLFSLVQDGFEFGMNQTTDKNGGVNYYQNSQDGMNEIIKEIMRQSGNIPPTLTKNQGERIGIFTARDVDFSKVYRLVPTTP